MSNLSASDVSQATQNFSDRTVRVASDLGAWVSNNIVDILIAAAIASVLVLILMGLRAFGHRLVGDGESDGINWRMIVGRVLAKTTMFFIVMCAAALVAEHAATPAILLRAISFLFVVAAAFQVAIWVRELILGVVQHKVGAEDPHSTLGSAIGIIRLLVTVALFLIAAIVILDNLGVNVTGLVAGLGIGGIAIGLAAQGIFSDLFAALSIIFDRPFRRGDAVRFDQVTGSVEEIGLKTTRIRSLDGEQVVISNTNLLNKQIHNFAQLEHRRFALPFGVVYQTRPEVLEAIPAMMREIVSGHSSTTFVRCGMVAFGASSLDFELLFDVHTAEFDYAFATRSAIAIAIARRFAEEGIEFAYPTTTNFTAAPDGTMVLPYPHVKMIATENLEPQR